MSLAKACLSVSGPLSPVSSPGNVYHLQRTASPIYGVLLPSLTVTGRTCQNRHTYPEIAAGEGSGWDWDLGYSFSFSKPLVNGFCPMLPQPIIIPHTRAHKVQGPAATMC